VRSDKGGPLAASYALGTLVSRNVPLMKILSLLAMIFVATFVLAQNHDYPGSGGMNPTKWHEDLAILREQMAKKHGNLFHTISREQYELAFDDFERRLPEMTDNQVKLGIMQIVALVNDGHTHVRFDTLGNHMLPIRLHYFADGLFVESTDRAHSNLLGGKVLRLGSMSVEEAYKSVRLLVSVDKNNEPRRRLLVSDLLTTPEVLNAIGAIKNSNSVEVVVEKNGRQIKADLPSGPFGPWNNHGWPSDPQGWINARSASSSPVPLWLKHSDKNYWSEFLPDGQTLYIQFNQVADANGGEPIAKFFPRVLKDAAEKKIGRVILDLRLNGGGNNELNRPIWHSILENASLNQKGKLWILIGPKTFSAAMNLVDDLELNTNALFAGEDTGESPNMWGDPVDIRLPNSGIVVGVSTLWWQFADPRDNRPYRSPDLPVALSSSDYEGNIDPVLKAVLASRSAVQ